LRKYRTPQQVTGKFARKIKRMLGLA